MGFLDELKRLTHPYEDEMEDDYDEDETYTKTRTNPRSATRPRPPGNGKNPAAGNTRSRPAATTAARWSTSTPPPS